MNKFDEKLADLTFWPQAKRRAALIYDEES
jgi:hypothetical protein